MKVKFEIDYVTSFNQSVCICGDIPELGSLDESKAFRLTYDNKSKWSGIVEIENADTFEYCYIIREGGQTVRREWGRKRTVKLDISKNYNIIDCWHDIPCHKFLYTSPFLNSFFKTPEGKLKIKHKSNSFVLVVDCPYVKKEQQVVLLGESDYLGSWNSYNALPLEECAYAKWQITLDSNKITQPVQYKFAIQDKNTKKIVDWEEGYNRALFPACYSFKNNNVQIVELTYNRSWADWKAAGVAIPVFSLRTADSFGVGEFSDLIALVDWAEAAGMKVIQILPVNDTTVDRKWTDSYPYNAISIYALHPIYLGLKQYPLKDKKQMKKFLSEIAELNKLKEIDYERVITLKEEYLKYLFTEEGENFLSSTSFENFLLQNKSWLFPYACFCYLRDIFGTADHTTWEKYRRYNLKELHKASEKDAEMKRYIRQIYFTQYLLHSQLLKAKLYAHEKGVVLKGDIPIGVNRNSVDVWENPKLFHLDAQSGAPPDAFSVFGQNWGFPTYNWVEMAKDGYSWWIKRFQKMADYFDMYRIDHILGFFRIWEIPTDSVQGLLGYFNPALPYSVEEIEEYGLRFDEKRMTTPYINKSIINSSLGKESSDFINTFLNQISPNRYQLKEFCDTQAKIKSFFSGKEEPRDYRFRKLLFDFCNEVLFIKDKTEKNKYHPRITAQNTNSYKSLKIKEKEAFNTLYSHFFYERHNAFWREQAMMKLPELISSTDMLVCGEDLGMIPDSVPSVMRDLQILSLEIERMPKKTFKKFENLNSIPYLSVCTTSTHDMSPIREWWHEDKDLTQQYFNEVLWKQGVAPDECTGELCEEIVFNHLNSPAMLAIIPLQDWLSVDENVRRENLYEERINIPALDKHYWRYRMHINIEELLADKNLSNKLKQMIKSSGRY